MKARISITVSEEVHNAFKSYCQNNGMKVSTKIELLIRELLEEENSRQAMLKEWQPEKGKI